MNYTDLAKQLIEHMHHLRRIKHQQNISRAVQGQSFMLWYIASQGGCVVPSDMSQQMNVSSARIAQGLNALEENGWISRRIDPADRRRILVELTPAGQAAAQERFDEIVRHTSDMLALLGPADAAEYVRLTGKLAGLMPAERGDDD